MKLLKKLASAAAVSVALMGAAQAETVLNNWVFNPTGGGFAGGTKVQQYLDITGNAFIQINPTSASTFNFVEHAVFSSNTADGKGAFNAQFSTKYGRAVTATFDAVGSGVLGGSFGFTSGTLNIYSNTNLNQYGGTDGFYGADQGTLIATFKVMAGGGGTVDGQGNPIDNGNVTVHAQATAPDGLLSGYFFGADGSDLSAGDLLSFAFTNANSYTNPDEPLVNELGCQFANYAPACVAGFQGTKGSAVFVSNNGQFKLSEVPEPGSLALFGIAMLGAGVVSRKRKSNV